MGVRLMSNLKYWWSDDLAWFCILTDDGLAQTTVSLTPEEAGLLSAAAEPKITNLDIAWEQINALGGVPANAIEEAQCETINQCLTIVAGLGGEDPLPKRAKLTQDKQGNKGD